MAVPIDRDEPQPLIIAGMPRSGTTLLRRLCDAHPRMRITNELDNYSHVGEWFPVYLARVTKRTLEIDGRFRAAGPFGSRAANWIGNVRDLVGHLAGIARSGVGRVSLAAIVEEARRAAPDARVVGDKMPQYIYRMDRLARIPELKRLVIYRDCRDVTSSFLLRTRRDWRHRPWTWPLRRAGAVARWWVEAVESMERNADRLFLVRYEDLVRTPRVELQRIADWLGVEVEGFPADWITDVSVGGYRRGLTDRELEEVLAVAGPVMRRWGYWQD